MTSVADDTGEAFDVKAALLTIEGPVNSPRRISKTSKKNHLPYWRHPLETQYGSIGDF